MSASTPTKIDLTTTIKEINRLHQAIIEADQTIANTSKTILQHRIDIGVMLCSVKDTDYGKHGKWEDWLRLNCPAIPLSTARLYMRLANNQDKLAQKASQIDNAVSDLSIRAARQMLSKPKTTPTTPRTRKSKPEAAVEPEAPAASPDLKDLLATVAADELVIALGEAEWEWTQLCHLHQLLSDKIDEHNAQAERRRHTETLLPEVSMSV